VYFEGDRNVMKQKSLIDYN